MCAENACGGRVAGGWAGASRVVAVAAAAAYVPAVREGQLGAPLVAARVGRVLEHAVRLGARHLAHHEDGRVAADHVLGQAAGLHLQVALERADHRAVRAARVAAQRVKDRLQEAALGRAVHQALLRREQQHDGRAGHAGRAAGALVSALARAPRVVGNRHDGQLARAAIRRVRADPDAARLAKLGGDGET